MIEIAKNGMVKLDVAKAFAAANGIEIYDYTKFDETGLKFDYCTTSELKILGIELTENEKFNKIVGFVRWSGYRGVMPLYSLKQLMLDRA